MVTSMNTPNTQRDKLLELHYGLLTDAEAEQWRQRIATEPEVARAWAQILQTSELMAQAARLEGIPRPPLPTRPNQPEATEPSSESLPPVRTPNLAQAAMMATDASEAGQSPFATEMPPKVTLPEKPAGLEEPLTRRRTPGWLLVVTAAIAIVAIAVPVWRVTSKVGLRASVALRLQGAGEPNVPGQSPNRFSFHTTHHRGSPVEANLDLVVQTRQAVLFQTSVRTDANGNFAFVVPGELGIPRDATLRVTASSTSGGLKPASAELPLAPTRCLAYLTTDKPLYRPGETVYYRALVLERFSLQAELDVPMHFELLDPSGAVVPGSVREGVTQRGVGNGTFRLPQSVAGGPYTLAARSLDGFFPEERQTLLVRGYRVPRFKKDLEFRRKSYGPGETVEADFAASRVEGGPLDNAVLAFHITLDGKVVYSRQARMSGGSHVISFPLPDHIDKGDGRLTVIVDDGGTRETLVKAIPIQIGKVLVDFYPEGGDLVAGLENRVYFAARNPLGDPVYIAGQVLDRNGRAVAQVATVRDGLGCFRFHPVLGERYALKITQPLDVTSSPELPRALDRPLVLDTGAGVFKADEPLTFTLRSRDSGDVSFDQPASTSVPHGDWPLIVNASCRGVPVGQKAVRVTEGDNSIVMPLPDHVGGVIRLTVSDARTDPPRPLVERLVFRRSPRKLNVDVVEQTAATRSPGDSTRLTLQVTDEQGQPTPAVLGVAVVDDGVLSLAEETRPELRTHFLLTSEIHDPADLEDANFYLVGDQSEAAEAVDLLLGTQGWRRFVERTVAAGVTGQPEDLVAQIERLIELGGTAGPSQQFDNLESIQSQLSTHTEALLRELRDLLWLCLFVAVPVVVFWLCSLLVRRMRLDTPIGLVLLVTLALPVTGAILGCGRGERAARTEADASVASPTAADGSAAEEDIELSKVPADAKRAPSEPEEPSRKTPDASSTRPQTNAGASSPDNKRQTSPSESEYDDATPPSTGSGSPGEPLPEKSRTLTPDDLRRLMAARGIDADALADELLDELRFPVREYAHRHVRRNETVREDFTETLYWHPLLLTDANGQATLRFDLSDAVTTFRVLADAHSAGGRIGSGGGEVVARLPFQLEPKLPLAVTTGDRIELPVAVINNRRETLPVTLEVQADSPLRAAGETERSLELAGDARRREHFAWDVVGDAAGTAIVRVEGTAGSLHDAVQRELQIAPAGYPVRESYSGVINESERVRLRVPESAVPGSLQVTMRAYPSPLADLVEGLESILREPHGCFEQASSSNYPNTLTLQYLKQHEIANPEVTRRAKELLDRGYRRLAGYECRKRGYEWFGHDPGHEALTAFGLLQFHDMQAVFTVDTTMVSRTLAWLMDRRDGQGGFRRNPRHLHQWSVSQELVDAYILWALTEAGQTQLDAELTRLADVAEGTDDPYFIALAAAALLNTARSAEGERLLERLANQQAEDGQLTGKVSITQSGGLSLTMETTALAALAWLKVPRYHKYANQAVTWIIGHRQGNGGFGSTQATVLCLKALVAHAKLASPTHRGGTLTVLHHGEMLGEASLPAGETTTVELTGLGSRLPIGDTELELRAAGYGRLPYSLEVVYHAPSPPSDARCPVRLTTELDRTKLRAGETVTVEATVRNVTDQGQPMTIAIVGLPGGLEPDTESLNALRDEGVYDYYELRPRELIFYWRTLPPSHKVTWQLPLIAAIPGTYTAPASRAYLYYTAEQKTWTEPLRVTIQAE